MELSFYRPRPSGGPLAWIERLSSRDGDRGFDRGSGSAGSFRTDPVSTDWSLSLPARPGGDSGRRRGGLKLILPAAWFFIPLVIPAVWKSPEAQSNVLRDWNDRLMAIPNQPLFCICWGRGLLYGGDK